MPWEGDDMTQSTVDRVAAIIVEVGGLRPDESLCAETRLVGDGIMLDSVAVLELLVALEKEFDVELRAGELIDAGAIHTLGALARFLDSKRVSS
jgi:acyl carrier protein